MYSQNYYYKNATYKTVLIYLIYTLWKKKKEREEEDKKKKVGEDKKALFDNPLTAPIFLAAYTTS